MKQEKIVPSSPIGVFDSGVGGLTVLKEISRLLPHEDVIYLGDTARVPYGSRTPQDIIKINHEVISFLIKQGAKLIVMACGTSSALAYPVVKDEYPLDIINLIGPGAQAAVAATKNKKIGVIATKATIQSQAFQNQIKEINKEIKVHGVGCPLFVPLVEGGFVQGEEATRVAKEYLKPLIKENIDTLILGCTHYPHLSKVIQAIVGYDVKLIDPAEEAVKETKLLLRKHNTEKALPDIAKYKFFVTGSPLPFQDVGSRLIGKPIVGVKQVSLT